MATCVFSYHRFPYFTRVKCFFMHTYGSFALLQRLSEISQCAHSYLWFIIVFIENKSDGCYYPKQKTVLGNWKLSESF